MEFLFKRFTYCAAFWLLTGPLYSQDSLKRIVADEVVIESTRLAEELYPSQTTVTYRDAQTLIAVTGSSLASYALSVAHPALDIRSYGTQSGIALASFRGLPPEFTAVYRNGIRISNQQHGLADLSKLGLGSADKVEVLTGTNAQVLSGDVGGAAIGIVSEPFARPQSASIGTDIITYDDAKNLTEKEYFAQTNYRVSDKFGVAFSGSYRHSLGDYPFAQTVTENDGSRAEVEVRRSNNDSYLTLLHAEPYYLLSESSRIQGFVLYDETARGVPGAVTIDYSGASSPLARQFDRDWLAGMILKSAASPEVDLSVSASYQNQYQTYIDPNIDVSDEYRNIIYALSLRSLYRAHSQLRLGLVLEANKNDLHSNQNLDSGSSAISRNKFSGLLSAVYLPIAELPVTASLRVDNISDQEQTQFLPALTAEYHTGGFTVGGSYGKFYHAPTFNQLYWKVGGNQDLEAARGSNINGWVRYADTYERLTYHLRVGGSYNVISNQIQWLPGKSGIWSPSNILNVVTSGVEFDGELRYEVSAPLAVTLSEQFQYLSSLNKTSGSLNEGNALPYAPKLRSVTMLTLAHSDAGSFSLTMKFRSERYTDLANNPTTTLPAVSTLDCSWQSADIYVTRSLGLSVRLSAANLTNVQYEEIPSFPLPGRTFTLGIELTYE